MQALKSPEEKVVMIRKETKFAPAIQH